MNKNTERTDRTYMHRIRRHSNEKFVKEAKKAEKLRYKQMLEEGRTPEIAVEQPTA